MKITDKMRLDWLTKTQTSLMGPKFQSNGWWFFAPTPSGHYLEKRRNPRELIDSVLVAERRAKKGASKP